MPCSRLSQLKSIDDGLHIPEPPMSRLPRAIAAPLPLLLASSVAVVAQTPGGTMNKPTRTPADRPIGDIEPVFELRGDMPTGVTVASSGRIFINFPRWGGEVPYTVAEISDGKVIPYPDA